MRTMADKIIAFNAALEFTGSLPQGASILNPFRACQGAMEASAAFYRKYYSDNEPRYLILGINPGRFGAGLTGVPFTDPKRLQGYCGINSYEGPNAHEPSSAFVYAMIEEYGGAEKFYAQFFITSICPLGFTAKGKNGRPVNLNYYDSKTLADSVRGFMIECLKQQLAFGIRREICFCLGTGKNEKHISALNKEYGLFGKVVALEHPRYIMQYKAKWLQDYITKYINYFKMLA
ncbi:MAG: DUF4918 family protein [Desulfovibrionaceae bacterium]|nr:DUF4918 family protein [Desulfovibrionaceae bacterium]